MDDGNHLFTAIHFGLILKCKFHAEFEIKGTSVSFTLRKMSMIWVFLHVSPIKISEKTEAVGKVIPDMNGKLTGTGLGHVYWEMISVVVLVLVVLVVCFFLLWLVRGEAIFSNKKRSWKWWEWYSEEGICFDWQSEGSCFMEFSRSELRRILQKLHRYSFRQIFTPIS